MEECVRRISTGICPNGCINGLDDVIQNTLIKFTDCIFLRWIKRFCKDGVRIQNDLEKLI